MSEPGLQLTESPARRHRPAVMKANVCTVAFGRGQEINEPYCKRQLLTEGEHSPLEDSPLWEWCGCGLGRLDAGAELLSRTEAPHKAPRTSGSDK